MPSASARTRTGSLLFVPRRWQRAAFLKWLKRVHAWTGFWGAFLFFGMEVSGFLLNHREVLKIDTGAPREVSRLDVAVPPGLLPDNAALQRWAKATLSLPGEGYAPASEPAVAVSILGKRLSPAERLTRVFTLVDGQVTVSTVRGSGVVAIAHDQTGVLPILQNMHKGTGLGIAWVLLIDTVAGALLTMSVTGLLLWSRLHGRRFAAVCLITGSIIWAVIAATPFFEIGS